MKREECGKTETESEQVKKEAEGSNKVRKRQKKL